MARVECGITIDRPIEEVFDYIHTPENDPEWQPQVIERRLEAPIGPGSPLVLRRKILGREVESKAEVVEYDPPHTSTSRSHAGPIRFEGGFHLRKTSGSTRVEFRADAEPTGVYNMAAEAFAEEFQGEIKNNLEKLKEALEA